MLCVICVLVIVAMVNTTAHGGTVFTEDFNGPTQSPLLEGYSNFTVGGGVIRRNGGHSNLNDRRYMRTVETDFNTMDFRYELTFTTTVLTQTSLNFIGLGRGTRRSGSTFGHNEPWESLFLRIHTPNSSSAEVTLSNHPATNLLTIGNLPTAGTHRARIDKLGNQITFSVDADFNGTFVADMSHTFTDLASVAPFLNNTNSRLFFGTTLPDDSFDDWNLAVPEPSSMVLFTLGLFSLLGYAWRKRHTC